MNKRLLVGLLVVAASVALMLFARASAISTAPLGIAGQPLAADQANVYWDDDQLPPDAAAAGAPANAMPIDSEFECSGGGHLQYGLLNTAPTN
jgi:hypothetical protein